MGDQENLRSMASLNVNSRRKYVEPKSMSDDDNPETIFWSKRDPMPRQERGSLCERMGAPASSGVDNNVTPRNTGIDKTVSLDEQSNSNASFSFGSLKNWTKANPIDAMKHAKVRYDF